MHWLTWIGLIFIGVGTAFTILGQQLVNNKSNEALQKKSDTITELTQVNITLSSDLSKISKEIVATVTGGDSFCYLMPQISDEKMNTIDFRLSHMGEYPVYDVLLRIWDASCLSKNIQKQLATDTPKMSNKVLTLEEWNALKKDPKYIAQTKEFNKKLKEGMRNCLLFQEDIGTIVPNKSSNMMDRVYLTCTIPPGIDPNNYSQEYSISMITRNGQYNQTIKIDIRKSNLHIYSKVNKRIPNSEPIIVREYESLDSDIFAIKLIK